MSKPLDRSINMLVKQYSSLFTLPTTRRILTYVFVITFHASVITCLSLNLSLSSLFIGVGMAVASFLVVLFTDFTVSKTFMKNDAVFNFRRCLALSTFSCFVWAVLIFIGSGLTAIFHSELLWIKVFLLGFCASLVSRLIVFTAVSMKNHLYTVLSALLQPSLCLIISFQVWRFYKPLNVSSIILFLTAAIPITFLTAVFFTSIIDRIGKNSPLHFSALSLFKAFMANWTEDLNAPIEEVFEQLGEEREVEVNVLAFKGGKSYKVAIVVPSFHPGPFKNIGSSPIPHLIQKTVSEKLNCQVAVSHGLFGHELDLASQKQNQKVLNAILNSLPFEPSAFNASPVIRVSVRNASSICQLFENCAFLVLTLAPKTTEDFPIELGEKISESASKHGLSNFIVVNAHNSINSIKQSEEDFKDLSLAASESLEKALKTNFNSLKAGAAKTTLQEYGFAEGMGPGGIVAVTLEIEGLKYAYIVFDGNNMVSGLREKILESLKELGIVDGEVMTSDTHVVNGVVLNRRGYHPIGEVMNHEKIVKAVKRAVAEALDSMEPVSVGWRKIRIPKVKVIGERQIEIMGVIASKAAKTAKKAALTIFPVMGVILIGLLAVV